MFEIKIFSRNSSSTLPFVDQYTVDEVEIKDTYIIGYSKDGNNRAIIPFIGQSSILVEEIK